VHDSVLATLLVAARGEDVGGAAAASARRALAQLDALRETDAAAGASHGPIDAHEFVWHLQSITTVLDPDTRFDYDPIPGIQVPADVSQALGEAMGEALRNSIRHADGDDHAFGPAPRAQVTRAVHVSVRAAEVGAVAIEVTVLDDGVGFDPANVDGARLGIEVSIRGRMSSVPGGRAAVVSRVGDGTRVVLQWRQQTLRQQTERQQ
jgi:two-component sensor histidine kinase